MELDKTKNPELPIVEVDSTKDKSIDIDKNLDYVSMEEHTKLQKQFSDFKLKQDLKSFQVKSKYEDFIISKIDPSKELKDQMKDFRKNYDEVFIKTNEILRDLGISQKSDEEKFNEEYKKAYYGKGK